jgi:hypothetical protein
LNSQFNHERVPTDTKPIIYGDPLIAVLMLANNTQTLKLQSNGPPKFQGLFPLVSYTTKLGTGELQGTLQLPFATYIFF